MKKNKSFTLIEILMVICIIGILAAMLIPYLSKAKEFAQAEFCMNNIRQVAIGYQHYLGNSDGEFPVLEYWLDDFQPIWPYVDEHNDIFVCPKTGNSSQRIWTLEGTLRNTDFVRGGTITDIEKNGNWNNGHGNNPYHFDISNPSPNTKAVVAAKKSSRILYERYWGSHFNGMFFNVLFIDDLHAEKEYNGVASYWMLDDRNWIETDLDPFPESERVFNLGDALDGVAGPTGGGSGGSGGGGGEDPPILGNCTFCGGDGVKDNGHPCNKCGGDGWL